MDVPPKDYAATNSSQFRHSNQLINRIIEENNQKQFSNIIDIGCGCGNVTYNLFTRIKPLSLLGIDKSPKMIEYAVKHYSAPQIHYEVQDFGVPFHRMNNSIKELSGKTSLIFTNECLHWISDMKTAAKNIAQLLADNGKLYTNISILYNSTDTMTDEDIENFGKYMNIPLESEQRQQWKNAFESAGINIIDATYFERTYIVTKDQFTNVILPIIMDVQCNYITVTDPIKRRDICNHYKKFLVRKINTFEKKILNSDMNSETNLELMEKLYQIVAEKKQIN